MLIISSPIFGHKKQLYRIQYNIDRVVDSVAGTIRTAYFP